MDRTKTDIFSLQSESNKSEPLFSRLREIPESSTNTPINTNINTTSLDSNPITPVRDFILGRDKRMEQYGLEQEQKEAKYKQTLEMNGFGKSESSIDWDDKTFKKNYLNTLDHEDHKKFIELYKKNPDLSFKEVAEKLEGMSETAVGGGLRAQINAQNERSMLDYANLIGLGTEELDDLIQNNVYTYTTDSRKKELRDKVDNLPIEQKMRYVEEFQNGTHPVLGVAYKDLYKNAYEMALHQNSTFMDNALDAWEEEDVGPNFGVMLANIPGSAIKTFSATLRGVTNPRDTLKGLAQLVGTAEGRQILADRYLSRDGIKQAMEEDPIGFASDIMSVTGNVAKIGGKATSLVGRLTKNPITKQIGKGISKIGNAIDDASDLGLSNLKSYGLEKAGSYLAQKNKFTRGLGTYLELTQTPLKTIWKGTSKFNKFDSDGNVIDTTSTIKGLEPKRNKIKQKIGEQYKDFASGMYEETRQRIKNNPFIKDYWEQTKARLEKEGTPIDDQIITETMFRDLGDELIKRIENYEQQLSDTGAGYELLKSNPTKYNLANSLFEIRKIFNEEGIRTNNKGKLESTKFHTPEEMNALNIIRDFIQKARLSGINFKDYHLLRQGIDKLAKYDKGGSAQNVKLLKKIRSTIDKEAKEKFPGLKEVDNVYSKELSELQKIKEGLVYRQGDRKGQYRDNFLSILKNIGGNNRSQMKNRLEERIFPGLSLKVEAINDIPKLMKAYQGSPTLMKVFGKMIGVGGGFGETFVKGAISLLVGSVLDELAFRPLGENMRKKVIDEIMKEMTPEAQQQLTDITTKMKAGVELTEEDNKILNQGMSKIAQAIEEVTGEKKEELRTKEEKQAEYNQQRVKKDRGVESQGGDEYIVIDGKKVWNKKPEGVKERDWKGEQFTNDKILPTERKNEKYVNSMNKLLQGKSENAEIGEGIILEKDVLKHIYEGHGAFAPENLVETVNNADGIVEHPFEQENVEYRLKKIPGTNNFFKAVVETRDGKQVTTFFEKITGNEKAFDEEMKKSTKPLEEKTGYKKEEMVEKAHNISSDGERGGFQPLSTDNSIAKNGENAREVGDFIDEMNETAKNTGKMDTLDYSRMSDEGLNALLEEKNLPKQERKTIEDILERRMQKEMQREAERGEKTSQFGVKDEVEFVRRAHQLQEMEKNIGKVGGKKVKDSTFKETQRKEREKKREKLIEEIGETYGIDQFEAYNRYLEYENAGVEGEQYTQRGGTKKKNDYDTEVQELLNKKKEEWSKQPQHIREMDDYEKQVRQDLIDSRGDGYEVRERDGGDAFIKNGDIIGRWNYKDGQISEIIFSTDDGFDAIMNNKRFLRNLPDDTVIHKQGEELSATAKELRDVKYGNEEKGKTMYQIAYHGGPNSFDRFDLSHLGEGEGTQMRGYGHYVTLDEKVAKGYAEHTTKNNKPEEYRLVEDKIKQGESFKEARQEVIEEIQSDIDEFGDQSSEYVKNMKRQIEKLENMKEEDLSNKTSKNLYTIDIPDEVKTKTPTGKNYLDYDKKITPTQFEKMKKTLGEYTDGALQGRYQYDLDYYRWQGQGSGKGGDLYDWISGLLGSDKKASEFLNSLGYDGIKYDGGVDGPCAVLFTDEAMNIVNHEKYQIADQTKTPEFKKRFKESKVVDENGNPLVVYHGTANQFTAFSKEMIGSNFNQDIQGFFFTDSKNSAEDYANTTSYGLPRSQKGNVMEVYLSIQNPLIKKIDYDPIELRDNNHERFIKEANNKGADGIIIKADKGESMYIPFNPNQIKSATDNIGTFDLNNPDIRYQKFGVARQGEKGITAQEGLGMKNFKNGRSVEEIAKHYGIETKIVDQILTPNGDKALGSYGDGLIKLAKDLKESTVPHELLHATFDMVDSQTKQKILYVVKKKLEREGKMEGIKDKDLNAEERLADSFSEYFRTGKFEDRTRPKGVMNKIKEFFKRVKDFITGVYKERNQIKKLFDDILEEKIKVEKSTSQTQYQSAGDIYSKNFKKRFGDWENEPESASKVVDENGNPQIMYHGSNAGDFTIFDLDYARKQSDIQAFFFSSYKDESLGYGKVRDFYLDIKNPADFDTAYGIFNKYKGQTDGGVKAREELQKLGYDGIDKGEGERVVFSPNQIKSATDNNGNFSKTDNDIRHQMAYHGSKADFDKFDSSHLGEGQGAQVHGRGHYVTTDPENAKFYAKDNLMFKGVQTHQLDSLQDLPPEGHAVITNIEELYNDGYGTIQECIENNQRVYDREVKRLQEEVKQDDNSYTRGLLERTEKRKEVADSLKPEDFKIPSRNFYEIDIPDPIKTGTPTGSNYLDENKKITPKQYEKFKILLNDYIKENNLPSRSLDVKYEDLTSRGKAGVGGGGSAIYDVIETILGSDKKASEFLNELGYDGIKYKDGKDGDSYVIFNDDKLNVKRHEKFQLDSNGVTTSTNLTTNDLNNMKNRNISILKTFDRNTGKDTLKNIKQRIKQDIGINIKDGYRLRGDDIKHSYNAHAYDSELGYGKSITSQDFTKIPDILENYDSAINTIDGNGNRTNFYELHKKYGNWRYNLVTEIVTLNNGEKRLSHKTLYINDANGRNKFNKDRYTKDIRQIRKNAKQQYGDRFYL